MRRWVTRAVVAWALWRVFGPEEAPRFRGTQEHPMRVPGRSVFVGDVEFFVRELGPTDAPQVVLVHGWGDHSAMVWYKVLPLLGRRLRVLALDLRNHGKTDRTREQHTVAELADDVAAVMAATGVGRATVVGYSLGGMVAQEMARRHPHAVERMVLAGTTAAPTPEWATRWGVRTVWWLGRGLDRLSRTELSRARWEYLIRVGAVPRRYARWLWYAQLERDPYLYWLAGFAALRFDSRDWVGRLRVPTLVIVNTADQLVPPEQQYDLASRLAEPTVVELVGALHEAPLTHAEDIAGAIVTFAGPRLHAVEEEAS